jgi:hypothetical protein
MKKPHRLNIIRTTVLKQSNLIKAYDRFFHYEPLSTSSFRKNLTLSEAIYFKTLKLFHKIITVCG